MPSAPGFVWERARGWQFATEGWRRSEIWIQEECQVNILLLLCRDYNSFLNRGTKRDMKAFSFPLLCSHQSKPYVHPLDYHRSSFPFCFSPPRVPIQSIFISPSVPFTAAFISTRSLNLPHNPLFSTPLSVLSPPRWQALSHFLHLSVIFLPFLLTFRSLFSLRLLPSPDFFLFYWHILSVLSLSLSFSLSVPTRFHSNALSLPPFSPKPSTDQLSSPAWCLFQPYTLWPTGQFKWFKGAHTHTHTHGRLNNVALKHVAVFYSASQRFTDPPKNLIYNNTLGFIFQPELIGEDPASTRQRCSFSIQKQCKQAVSALY